VWGYSPLKTRISVLPITADHSGVGIAYAGGDESATAADDRRSALIAGGMFGIGSRS